MEDAPRPQIPHISVSLSSLALIFGMAAPLVGVISFVILLRADVNSLRQELVRIEAQNERALQEHARIRQNVEYLCFARRRDDRDSGRPPLEGIC